MPDFRYLQRPVYSPTRCALCGSADVPVIDTGVEADVIGRIYLCCKPHPSSTNLGCAEQIANAAGWMDPDYTRALVDDLAQAHEHNEQLAQQLADADEPLLIDAEELQQAIERAIDAKLKPKKKDA